jgi:hypothetical protein
MKKQSLRIFLMFGFLAILAVSSAHAQSGKELTANIPFSFSVEGKTFPAGEYRVERLNPRADPAALAIKSADGRMKRVVLTAPVQADEMQEMAKLVFTRYGDQYFLAQVWTGVDKAGLELPKSRSERTLARNAGENRAVRVAVALNTRRR